MTRPIHKLKSQTFYEPEWQHIRERHPNPSRELEMLARSRSKRIYVYTMYCGASFESGGAPWIDYVESNECLDMVDCEDCKEEYGLWLLAESDDPL